MRTVIPEPVRVSPGVADAEAILRTCVHCGFCNATCPTYLLTGNELEGPRGRIYLMKNVLEGQIEAGPRTLEHIDNCLGCLSCETTCPSGVKYGQLLEDGRERLQPLRRRAWFDRLQRALLSRLLPSARWLRPATWLAARIRPLRPMLPSRLGRLLDEAPASTTRPRVAMPGVHPAHGTTRMRVTLLTGCAQQVLGAQINDAAVRLLTRLGVEVTIPAAQICCGALTHHMGERQRSRQLMEKTIDTWDPMLRDGADAIVLTTSGCQTVVADYGHLFADTERAEAAARVSAAVRDISQILVDLPWPETASPEPPDIRVAYHDACSLQHGLQLSQPPRDLLRRTGIDPIEIPEGHVCCGSAGTYHLLRPELAGQLQQRKKESVLRVAPDVIVAGNIGCLEQLAHALPEIAVIHTVEWLDWMTGGPCPAPVHHAGKARNLSTTDISRDV